MASEASIDALKYVSWDLQIRVFRLGRVVWNSTEIFLYKMYVVTLIWTPNGSHKLSQHVEMVLMWVTTYWVFMREIATCLSVAIMLQLTSNKGLWTVLVICIFTESTCRRATAINLSLKYIKLLKFGRAPTKWSILSCNRPCWAVYKEYVIWFHKYLWYKRSPWNVWEPFFLH